MRGTARLGARLLAALALAAGPVAAQDGLEIFRALAARVGPAPTEDAVAALYRLVDDEILASLSGGGFFASPEIIQDRLEGFNSAWGGARFRVLRLGGDGPRTVTVALYGLTGVEGPGSVRVLTGIGPGAALARTITHAGTPEAFPWPATRGGAPQLALAWVGAPGPSGRYPLRLEIWRVSGGGLARVWSTEEAFPEGLQVVSWRVGAGEILLRYELHYPGWKPGCDGQAEQEEVLRHIAATDTVTSARRRTFNAWHRDLARDVTRFFAAVERGDRRALAELVPDPTVRARLPERLVSEPACDVANADTPSTVVVAATDERGGAGNFTLRPWSLLWSRQGTGWRLAGAAPVLQ